MGFMKINLDSIDREKFYVSERPIHGSEVAFLITPQPTHHAWELEELHLRSSVWNSDGVLISAGFPKFFNFEERPHVLPFENDGVEAIEKLDGCLLIVSVYKNQLIIRTRGGISAGSVEFAGNDIEQFKESHKNFLKRLLVIGEYDDPRTATSWLFEWCTPNQKIVVDYGPEPKFFLIGAVDHSDYTLWTQEELDSIARKYGMNRPKRYSFDSIPNLIKTVEALKNEEGVVVYYKTSNHNLGWGMRKIKSIDYLAKHAFKSNLTMRHLAEMAGQNDLQTIQDCLDFIEATFDFELMVFSRDLVTQTYEKVIYPVQNGLKLIREHVESNKEMDQKTFAVNLQLSSSIHPSLQQFAYQLRSTGEIKKDSYIKLLVNTAKNIEKSME